MAAVRYIVDDVDAVLAFYTEHLGFELIERWGPPFALIGRDDLRLWLAGPGTSPRKPMPDGREPEPGGWNRLVLEVDDIQQTVAAMRQAGIAFRNDIIEGPGGKQILAEDPSGNPVEIFEAGS